ncbi:hypothetical protein AwDysgo_12920 [Bacteroidales bacterium]|nr:hypothetical protein AwDysgo_12920 [Bacteroidales bacterium]
MAEIDGGGLHFESTLDNEKLNSAINETMRRIQGLSDASVAGGSEMDAVFRKTADDINRAFQNIDKMADTHQAALRELETEYARLGEVAGNSFRLGKDDEYRAFTEKQNAIKGEITIRKQLLVEIGEQADALAEVERKQEAERKKIEESASAHVSFRSRIKELKEEMMTLVDQGIDEQSDAYRRLAIELGRLTDIQGDVAQQGRILANDESRFQGVITGLSGLAGGFSAATGAMSLFAGENEDLQKIMVKVQSVMAITMGMQQVSQTLNKDSAFQQVTLNGLKKWWTGLVAKATVVETAETVATNANTAAKRANNTAVSGNIVANNANTLATGGQAAAAAAGTIANIGLAGAFRMVGAAIKSIPVFGWILAGISALIGLYSYFSSKAREAAKAQEEFNKAMIETAYKPIAAIENLSLKWNQLGDDLDAKKKFVLENKKAFDELGVSVNDVADAERVLNSGKEAFIAAQIAKAKAMIYVQQSTEKIKKQMELEAEIGKMSDRKTYLVGGGSFGGGSSYEAENYAKTNKKNELEDLRKEINLGYKNAALEESESLRNMTELGVAAVNTYNDGTIGAIEQAIQAKQAALKLLANNDEYKKDIAEIADLQKQLEGITGKKITSIDGGSSKSKDPFLDKLEKQKKEYQRFMKWVNSADEVLVTAANKEFEGLLKQGSTYIDYLKMQRETILSVDVANRTKTQNNQLRTLNDQISEETKKTVLESFNTELSEQLDNARSIMEMLNIIEQKRKMLANDGTELDNSKKGTLDDAEKNIVKQAEEETNALLEKYSSYLARKIKLEEQFTNDIKLLEKRRSEATTDAQRTEIDKVIANQEKQHARETQNGGDTDYTSLLKDYATFEQKKQAIIDEFDEKRQKAVEHGNQELIEELNKAQAKALSGIALGEMQSNPNWEKMFGNLDEISTKKLEELLAMIEGQSAFLGVEFDPKDLETIKNKIQEIKGEIKERNPFKALVSSIKDYSKAADDESKKKALTNMFESASSATDLLSGSIDAVVSGMEKMGVQMDEETQTIINDISGIVEGASQLAIGIASGNPLSVIQGGIGLLTSAFDLFNSKDRNAEKAIKKHAEALKILESSYQDLSRAVDKALGSSVYDNQKASVDNMRKQKEHLQEMIDAEGGKKKTDHAKIEQLNQQLKELGYAIEDTIESIANDVLQTTGKSFADELGDALVNAFGKGESAAEAFGATTDKIIKQAVLNQLKKNFLETQLQGALDNLYKSMGGNKENFSFDGLTDAEIARFKAQVADISNGFNRQLEGYSELFKDVSMPDSDTSLTGAVKGVTEETASMLGGQINAMRINQIQSIEVMRQQLFHLANIDRNTGAIDNNTKFIKNIYDKMTASSDPLRSQGLS